MFSIPTSGQLAPGSVADLGRALELRAEQR